MAQRLLGLTGLYCAGKNHVAALLEKRGLPALDVDRLGHEAIRAERDAIVRRFGPETLGEDGQVDRRLLGKRVFGRAEDLAALEAIVHPAANRLTGEWIALQEARQNGLCVINAALLHRSLVFPRLDVLIVVWAPLPVRFLRARKRDSLPLGELVQRFSSQRFFPFNKINKKPGGPKLFPVSADIYTVDNSGFPGSEKKLEKRIDDILEGLYYGKEETITGGRFGGSVSGYCGGRRDSDF
ncbi:MAG: dephospho-CoA kinase [Treponema sp.]|jgi:dephospho-CoA kinase|nr:dephospho-CoA kinase [Treponema sp.]